MCYYVYGRKGVKKIIGVWEIEDGYKRFKAVGAKRYIYEYENALWELMLQDGVQASCKDGTKILDVREFSMKEISPGIFIFSCTNEAGKPSTITVTSISQSF